MSLSELYNIKKTITKGKGSGPSSFVPTQAGVVKKCGFCHTNQSNYICPTCNAPYCSLACFRSELHKACSSPFAEKSARENVDQDQIVADEDERKRMMDILKRLEETDMEGEGAQEEEEEEVIEEVDLPDLDNASIEELLSYLSPDERARFEIALKHPDRAQALVEQLFGATASSADISQSKSGYIDEGAEELGRPKDSSVLRVHGASRGPWWTKDSPKISQSSSSDENELIYESFKLSLLPLLETKPTASSSVELSSGKSSSSSKRINLAYNIIALLLVYAYILRHLGLERLSDLLPRTSKKGANSSSSNGTEMKVTEGEGEDEMPPLELDVEGHSSSALSPAASATTYPTSSTTETDQEPRNSQDEADFERTEQLSIALALFSSLSPFLSPPPKAQAPSSTPGTRLSLKNQEDFSKTLLASTEEASLFFLARLNSLPSERRKGGVSQAAELLKFLLEDVKAILEEKKVLEVREEAGSSRSPPSLSVDLFNSFSSRGSILRVLADIYCLFGIDPTFVKKRLNPTQAKLLFYAKFILTLRGGAIPTFESQRTWKNQAPNFSTDRLEESLPGEFEQLLKGARGVERELERLESEMERDEDEKRWKATDRATVDGWSRQSKIQTL